MSATTATFMTTDHPLMKPLIASAFAHLLVVVSTLLFTQFFGTSSPMIDPLNSMEVSMVVLPKSKRNVPDRAARVPVPKGVAEPATPKKMDPAPIRESDLKIHTPEAKQVKGSPDRSSERAALLRDLAISDLLANAPDGDRDRDRSDPNSTTDLSINAMGTGMVTDPEWAAYQAQLQSIFLKGFHPLKTITDSNPSLVTLIQIEVDPLTGRVKRHSILKGSGNPSYDASAERAVAAVSNIPLPPDRFLDYLQSGFEVKYVPPGR